MTTNEALATIQDGKKMILLNSSGNNYIRRSGMEVSLIIDGAFMLGGLISNNLLAQAIDKDIQNISTEPNWGLPPNDLMPNTGTTLTYENAWKKAKKALRP